MARSSGAPGFFEVMAWVFLAIVVSGFGAIHLLMPEMTSPMRPTLAVHTGLFAAWFVLLIVQTRLIGARNWKLHQRVGKASVALAFAMVVAGCLITYEAYHKPGWSIAGMSPQGSLMFPLSDMVFFPLAYTLGVVNRRKGDAHKRYMLFAGMVMLDPALARLVAGLGLFPPLIMAVELALVGSVMLYDRQTLGRVHSATWFGAGLIIATYPLAFIVAPSETWSALVTQVLGAPSAL